MTTSKKDTKRRLFFTSDLWLYRDNIIDIRKRNFKTVEDMDDTLVEKWNINVRENDVVFILGNFVYDFSRYDMLLNMLRGVKVLLPTDFDKRCIIQNNDLLTTVLSSETGGVANFENFFESDYISYKAYESVGLTTSESMFSFLQKKIEDNNDDFLVLHNNIVELPDYGVVLSHYPLLDWNGKEKGVVNLHGGTIPTPTSLKEEKRFNVGVDFCGYAPVAYDNIMKIISKAK